MTRRIVVGLVVAAFVAALDRIVHVHLSDADETRLHLPLGEGTRNLVGVLAALGVVASAAA